MISSRLLLAARHRVRMAACRLLLCTALVAFIGTGCSNATTATGVGGDADAAATPGARPAPAPNSKLADLAACMRDNGITDFPDPDSKGIIQFRGGTQTPEFKAAREKCRSVMPDGLGAAGGGQGGDR